MKDKKTIDKEIRDFRREELAARRAEVRRENEELERAELIEEIEDSTGYRVGYRIGVTLIILFSPLILIVVLFLAFAAGAPLFVLGFLGDADQWKSKRRRY